MATFQNRDMITGFLSLPGTLSEIAEMTGRYGNLAGK
jgi:hypothetical protein